MMFRDGAEGSPDSPPCSWPQRMPSVRGAWLTAERNEGVWSGCGLCAGQGCQGAGRGRREGERWSRGVVAGEERGAV